MRTAADLIATIAIWIGIIINTVVLVLLVLYPFGVLD